MSFFFFLQVCRFDGSYRFVLVHDGLDSPRGIALHPEKGLMFWTDWGYKNKKIERAALDGSKRTVLVNSTFFEHIGWPNGLTIDYSSDLIYWTDATAKKIFRMSLNGGKRMDFLLWLSLDLLLTCIFLSRRVKKDLFIDKQHLLTVENNHHYIIFTIFTFFAKTYLVSKLKLPENIILYCLRFCFSLRLNYRCCFLVNNFVMKLSKYKRNLLYFLHTFF